MTAASPSDVDQRRFDVAWEARERSRRQLGQAHLATGGNDRTASLIRKNAQEMIDRIGSPDEAVATGRIDSCDGETLYIGKRGISDNNGGLLVINWQRPAATPSYQASYVDPMGLALKRSFNTDKNVIVDFDDIVFADLAARIEDLTEQQSIGIDDQLLRDLEADRTDEMRDIVSTIHASQHGLIAEPLDRLLVVQGGPGTGKTAVALHRASWLLYNYRDTLQASDVLVIGPSKAFAAYIRRVLPGLGDQDVQHTHVRSLGPRESDARSESFDVAKLKGEARMAALLGRALRSRVRLAEGDSALSVGSGGNAVAIPRVDVEAAIIRYAGLPTYSAGRAAMRQWVSMQVSSHARQADATGVDAALERVWPQLTAQAFIQDLLGSRNRLTEAAGDDFTAGDIGRLYRQSADRLADERWSDSDIALLDEAEFLIQGSPRAYGHIVLDEAQDLTAMQLRSIQRRSASGSYTVVGDIAQSTGPGARDDWADVIEALANQYEAVEAELEFGYRVPRQIFELAARLLPYAAPQVSAPRIVRDGPADPDILTVTADDVVASGVEAAQRYAGQGQMVGIICADSLREELIKELHDRRIAFADAAAGRIKSAINVLSAEESKGLEFDAVVVVEPAEIAAFHARYLYIALTRSTRYLSLVQSRGVNALNDVMSAPPAPSSTPESEKLQPATRPVVPEPSEDLTVQDVIVRRSGGVKQAVVLLVAEQLADEVRGSVAPELWPEAVAQLVLRLGVNDDSLLDAMITVRDM